MQYFLSSSTFRYAAEQEKSGSSSNKDDHQRTRQIKKPHYRLPKTQAPDRKPVKETEDCTRRNPQPHNAEHCFSKAKHHISDKDISVRGSETSEKGTSNPRGTDRPESILEGRLDEKYLPRSPSKLTKVKETNLASDEQKLERHHAQKRHKSNESSSTEKNSSVTEESSRHKRRELVKEIRQRHEKIGSRHKSQSTQGITSTASTTYQSSSTTKQNTSESSLKSTTLTPRSTTSLSHKTAWSSSSQQQKRSLPAQPCSFKIPKNVQLRSEDDNGDSSASKKFSDRAEISHTVDSTRNSKQASVVQHHSCLDGTPSASSERQDKRSSLTHRSTASEVCYDQVVKTLCGVH